MCEAGIVRTLVEMVDLTLEDTERPIWIWECISDSFLNINGLERMMDWQDTFLIGYFVKKFFIQEIMN